MDLREYVRLLRRRWRLITLCTLLALGTALGATLIQTKVYTARIQLFVSAQDRAAAGDISSAYTGGLFTQQRVKSYANILKSPRVGELVVADLNLNRSPTAVARHINASAPLDTVLINVSVTDPDPAMAQRIANSVAQQFPKLVDTLERPAVGGVAPVKVSAIQSATLPTLPTSPRPKLNLGLGLLVGLGIGIAAAVLREALDTSVKAPDAAEELVGAPMLGAISYDPEAGKRPLVVHVSPNSTRAEAFRQLRTNLQFVDIEHPLRSVVVTSSVPGEGKSTTTCNMAITLAQAGVRVILVEGDLRRPRIADYMGMEGAVGLTSVLLGRTPLEDALQPFGDGVLQVLPSGPLPPNPSELLGSSGMEDLLRRLEARADIVLIDAPPLLPVTDAAVLGSLTSGLIMLVRSNSTRREQLKRATATVHGVGATVLGVILNMVPTRGPDAYAYGYGYGYGGRYYNRPGDTGRLSRDEAALGRQEGPDALAGAAWSKLRGNRRQQAEVAPTENPVSSSRSETPAAYAPSEPATAAAPTYAPSALPITPTGSGAADILPHTRQEENRPQ